MDCRAAINSLVTFRVLATIEHRAVAIFELELPDEDVLLALSVSSRLEVSTTKQARRESPIGGGPTGGQSTGKNRIRVN